MAVTTEHIEQMIERVVELTRVAAIWRVLVNEDSWAHCSGVVSSYEDYFACTSQSLFQTFSVITYQIFETRKDSVSLSGLLREMQPHKAQEAAALQKEINLCRPTLAKVFAVRGNVYAHRNKEKPVDELFNAAGVNPDNLSEVVMLAQSVVVGIATTVGLKPENLLSEFSIRAECAASDTQRLLRCLAGNAL